MDPSATMKDVILRSMEIGAIRDRLAPEDSLLDMGCGNAFGSIQFAQRCKTVLAVDYSDRMIAMASDAIRASGCENVHAVQEDVLTIGDSYPGMFSAASCVRCLINLATEAEQYSAIAQLAKSLMAGGRLFLVEGIAENFAALNEMRRHAGLPVMNLDWHNNLLEKAPLDKELERQFVIEEVVDFGEYYFLSRVVHPLLVAPEEPSFHGRPNHVARDLWRTQILKGRLTNISTLLLYVCRKR
jgi:SAM-dependent methyltransferase